MLTCHGRISLSFCAIVLELNASVVLATAAVAGAAFAPKDMTFTVKEAKIEATKV